MRPLRICLDARGSGSYGCDPHTVRSIRPCPRSRCKCSLRVARLPNSQIEPFGFSTCATSRSQPSTTLSHSRLVSPYGGSAMHRSAQPAGKARSNAQDSVCVPRSFLVGEGDRFRRLQGPPHGSQEDAMVTDLTTEEACVLAAYRAMDRRAKRDTMTFVLMQAREFPEPQPPRRLPFVEETDYQITPRG